MDGQNFQPSQLLLSLWVQRIIFPLFVIFTLESSFVSWNVNIGKKYKIN